MALSGIAAGKPGQKSRSRSTPPASTPITGGNEPPAAIHRQGLMRRAVVEEARRGGLLDGDKSEHVSFRAPPALVEAAKRQTGLSSTSDLGMLALAMLAQPDPVAAFMTKTRGVLGPDHDLGG